MANAFTIETAVAAGLLLTACSGAQPRRGAGEGEVAALADRYFDEVFFKYSPTRATRAGLHEYDTRLEDFSPAAIDAQVAALKDFEIRFADLQVPPGSPDAEADRELLLSDIRSNLLELTTIRRWEKDPDLYSGGITASAFVIMSRNFAPPDERLRSLVAREKQMPAMLEVARQNLKAPPRRYTEIALEQLPGILSFFEKDVPAAFKDAKDEATLREFAQWNGQVVSALRDPTYLVYTLGKLQILKLRDDYRKKTGDAFRLQDFHDAFLRQGFPPVKIIRRAMLGDGSATL
jgi:uncharacterized protein (DUF885 family)